MKRDGPPIHPVRYQPVIAGRDRERAFLGQLLDDAVIERHGASVLISGEAGIGKTTLVHWLTGEANDQGLLNLTGYCFDQSAAPPYGPWNELLAGYRPAGDLPAAVPVLLQGSDSAASSSSQAALFERSREFFTVLSACRPLLLVLEDLHWSDPASLELLRYLARQIVDLPILLALTYRDDEITREHELFTIIPHLIREAGTERLELRRLDAAAIDALLGQFELRPGDRERLAGYLLDRAGGNPLFIHEILRSLLLDGVLQKTADGMTLGEFDAAGIPPLVGQLIERRLVRLDEKTRQALEVAAVIGQDVPVELWSALLATEQRETSWIVEQAISAHVLEEAASRQGLRFVHALVRDVCYENIPLIERRALHRRVGEALIEQPHPDPDAIAGHFQQAGDERALEWLVRAGMRAAASSAYMTAADRYLRAAELLEGDTERADKCGWLIYLAGSLLRYADNRRSLELLKQSAGIASQAGEDLLAAYATYHQGIILCHRGQIGDGLPMLIGGVDDLEQLIEERQLPADTHLAELAIRSLVPGLDTGAKPRPASPDGGPLPIIQRSLVVNWLSISGHYRDAVAMGEPWIERMQAISGNAYLRTAPGMSCHLGLGMTYSVLGRPEDGRVQLRFTRRAAEAYGDYWLAAITVYQELNLVQLPYSSEDVHGRRWLLAEADRIWERLSTLSARMTERPPLRSLVDVLEGRWDDAIPVFEERRQWAQLNAPGIGLYYRGLLTRYQGQPELAEQLVGEVLPEGPATRPGNDPFIPTIDVHRLAVELALDAGDFDKAAAWLTAHERWLDWSGAVVGQAEHKLLLARFHLLQESVETAREHAESALRLASNPRQPLAIIAAERMLGEVAAAECRYDDATTHFTSSAELAGRCGAPFERARTLLPWAELCRQTGDLPAARALLRELREICEPLQAELVLNQAEAIDQQLRRTSGRHPSGLTRREIEIIELAAEGMTNAEIGAELFISPRTVSQHLRAIFNKLGVANRTAAVARWSEIHTG